MKKLVASILVGVTLLAATGTPRIAGASQNDAMAERALALVQQGAAIVESDRNNCPKMGADLSSFLDAHMDEIAGLKAWGKKLTAAERRALEDKYKPRFEAAASSATGGVMACRNDPAVRAAIGRLRA